eukprot:7901369-Lingulodinium_polyedra.AAC.1
MAYVMAKPPPPALPAGHGTSWAAVPLRASAPAVAAAAQHTDTQSPAGPSAPAACVAGAPGPQ